MRPGTLHRGAMHHHHQQIMHYHLLVALLAPYSYTMMVKQTSDLSQGRTYSRMLPLVPASTYLRCRVIAFMLRFLPRWRWCANGYRSEDFLGASTIVNQGPCTVPVAIVPALEIS